MKDPLALLRDLERRGREAAAGLPQQIEVKRVWFAVGFRVGKLRLVSPLDEVAEILDFPRLARVPGTKSWVKGMANVRGNLLPIMDLKEYLTGRSTNVGTRSRVLVVQHKGLASGLLVDEVLGMKHFYDEERCEELPDVAEGAQPYLVGAYQKEERHWGVFSLHGLAESPAFIQAAV